MRSAEEHFIHKILRNSAVMTKKHGNKTSLVGPGVVAQIMGVSRNTVLNWGRKGQIPSIRIGKIYRFSLEKISEMIDHPLESYQKS